MRPPSPPLIWIALTAIGSEGSPQIIPPGLLEGICRENEAKYSGPPMPRISAPTFSGRGCPSPDNRLAYNYLGKWRCHGGLEDAQFAFPEVRLRAEDGDVVKADCAISFQVDALGEGYQVALDEGILLADVELSRGSEARFVGAAVWGGGKQTVSTYLASTESLRPTRGLMRGNSAASKCSAKTPTAKASPGTDR